MASDWKYGKHIKRNISFKRNVNVDDSDMRLLEQRSSKNTRLRPSRSFNEIFATRNSEYVSEYNTRIPKAAGFQKLSKHGIDELVHRMYDDRVKKYRKQTDWEEGPPQNAAVTDGSLVRMPPETLPRKVRIQTSSDDELNSTQRSIRAGRRSDTLHQLRNIRALAGDDTLFRPHSRIRQASLVEASSDRRLGSTGTETCNTLSQGRRKLTAHEDHIIGECLNQPTVTSLIRKMLRTLSPVDVKDVNLYCKQCRLPISQRKTRSPYYNFFLDETERLYFMKKRK